MENYFELKCTDTKTNKIIVAYCVEYDDKVVVKKGSQISDKALSNLSLEMREKRITAPIDDNGMLLEDVEVENIVEAAMFALAIDISTYYCES